MSTQTTLNYPPSPANVDPTILYVSKDYKKEVTKVTFAIVAFILTYLLLIGVVAGISALSFYLGIMVMTAGIHFITIIGGLGLMVLSAMLIYFIFKFMFTTNKVDRSNLIQITEEEEPVLFEFIRRISEETKAPFPKKVYLASDVNAAVFYNSGLWSMFFPVRKNLLIGLGLVNSLNTSELKAVLAHEFGHFSQHSMKLGSYVYNVNKIIYNMLYENEGYSSTITAWAQIHGIFALLASLTVYIVQGIQFVQKQMYKLVNKAHLSLSRQMEFHADTVAASASGTNNITNSLYKIDMVQSCFQKLMDFYNSVLSDNKKPENVYPQLAEVVKYTSIQMGVELKNGYPVVDANTFSRFNTSRIVIKDQWASHPDNQDREKYLQKFNLTAEIDNSPAWDLFQNAEQWQKQATDIIYANATFKSTPELFNVKQFNSMYEDKLKENYFDKAYSGYYDGRDIKTFELEELKNTTNDPKDLSFEKVYSDAVLQIPYKIKGIISDLHILSQLEIPGHPIKTFEFDGTKYTKFDIPNLRKFLQEEMEVVNGELLEEDKKIFRFFYHKASEINKEILIKAYERMFQTDKKMLEYAEIFKQLDEALHPIYTQNLSRAAAVTATSTLKVKEIPLKKILTEILHEESMQTFITNEQRIQMNDFLHTPLEYITELGYHETNLDKLRNIFMETQQLLGRKAFRDENEMLLLQLEICGN